MGRFLPSLFSQDPCCCCMCDCVLPPSQVKARIVYVSGQPVLRSNMYDLEDGEPSVFDKELHSECSTRGMQGLGAKAAGQVAHGAAAEG